MKTITVTKLKNYIEIVGQAASIVKDTVCKTLGPGGVTVLIDVDGHVVCTKAGYKVAEALMSNSKEVDAILKVIKSSVKIATNKHGDGTTTTAVIITSILEQAINAYRSNPSIIFKEFAKGLKEAEEEIGKKLEQMSIMPTSAEETLQMCKRISLSASDFDEEISEMVSNVVSSNHGLVSLSTNNTKHTFVEDIKGVKIEGMAYSASSMYGENSTLSNPLVFVTNSEFNNSVLMGEILKVAKSNQRSVVVYAPKFSINVLQTIIKNKDVVNCCGCTTNAPFGVKHEDYASDLCDILGCELIPQEKNEVEGSHVGECKQIEIVPRKHSIILEGKKNREKISRKLKELQDSVKNMVQREGVTQATADIEGRIARLKEQGAVIHIGGDNEMHVKERFERGKDTVNSAKAFLRGGALPGGGATMLKISKQMKVDNSKSPSFCLGYECAKRSMLSPIVTLIENYFGECEESKNLINKVMNSDGFLGFDGKTGALVDMGENDTILDSALVVKQVVENALSTSRLILNSQSILVSYNEEQRPF